VLRDRLALPIVERKKVRYSIIPESTGDNDFLDRAMAAGFHCEKLIAILIGSIAESLNKQLGDTTGHNSQLN